MLERYDVIGAGIALLDLKLNLGHRKISKFAGGITPNVIATINSLESNFPARVFACVGDDQHGNIYINQSPELSKLRIATGGKTGYSENDFDGHKVIKSRTYYNCATNFQILDSDLKLNERPVFITDVFTLQLQDKFKDIQRMARYIESRDGFVALNLAGVTHLKGDFGELLSMYQLQPSLVFGNSKEHKHLDKGLCNNKIFTKAIVQVETMGEFGSTIKFRDTPKFRVQANFIEADKLVDEFGAGDTFMGTFISGAFSRDISNWTPVFISKVAGISSLASSLVLQTSANRLGLEEAQYIKSLLKEI